ncbi:uncharacterized protein LOC128739809 [Sabethes cyaneus]|uniref:uncharacterized protein LOC128739809 n=1 Tax=Sabethes cyaneus TaxID=53552 RepID=UPI00237E0A4C|nr:uncharacterized protein LOC128739809 [Sabethes cyaneus]
MVGTRNTTGRFQSSKKSSPSFFFLLLDTLDLSTHATDDGAVGNESDKTDKFLDNYGDIISNTSTRHKQKENTPLAAGDLSRVSVTAAADVLVGSAAPSTTLVSLKRMLRFGSRVNTLAAAATNGNGSNDSLSLLECQVLYKGFTILFGVTAANQLPPKVIETRETLLHDLHSLQEVIPKDRLVHNAGSTENAAKVQNLFDEFLLQNQDSISAVLRVLKLVDRSAENVIQDCVRIFDLEVLSSANVIFEHVSKPLLFEVRDLCELIAAGRLDTVEVALEKVEREAANYRTKLDQTLQDIALVSSQLAGDHITDRVQFKEETIWTQLQQLNQTFREELDRSFSKYFNVWIGKYKKFAASLPEGFDSDENLGVVALFDFLDLLDNETSVLQDELEEFLDYWVYLVEESLESVTNGSLEVVDFLQDYPLERLLDGETSLKCVSAYYQNLDQTLLTFLDNFYQCVEYDQEMSKAFHQLESILNSTDKAVEFVLDSYITCGKLVEKFNGELDLEECLEDLSELLEQTEEFVERKANEIYYHVEDALVFSEVIMGACVHMRARDAILEVGERLSNFDKCNIRVRK